MATLGAMSATVARAAAARGGRRGALQKSAGLARGPGATAVVAAGAVGAGDAAACAHAPRRAGLSSSSARYNVIRRCAQRKMRRGVERLPSQGPDPAISDVTPNGWRVAAAAVVERYPVVMPDPHPFAAKYLEGRFLWQQSVARPIPESWFQPHRDELGAPQKATDDVLAEMYEPAPIITEADKTNNMRSLHRSLRERLYLVIRRTPASSHYQFPQTLTPSPQVSMRAYAELALRSAVPAGGDDPLKTYFISNSPATHLAHVYGAEYQRSTGFYGVKVFFYRAQLVSGSLPEEPAALPGGADYAWAREDELGQLLSPETRRAIDPILFGVGDKVDFEVEYEEPAAVEL